jgi:hypothetical protein
MGRGPEPIKLTATGHAAAAKAGQATRGDVGVRAAAGSNRCLESVAALAPEEMKQVVDHLAADAADAAAGDANTGTCINNFRLAN